jgi:hypothetical protein
MNKDKCQMNNDKVGGDERLSLSICHLTSSLSLVILNLSLAYLAAGMVK